MKKIITIYFVLFSVIIANAQNIRVVYKKSRIIEKELIGRLNNYDIKEMLYCYKSGINYNIIDEDDYTETTDDFKMITQKNHINKKVTTYMTFIDDNYLISDAWLTNWKLTNETQKILGYDCKKAVLDSTTFAWYAPSIPISDGPSFYCGLPGLILKVETPRGTFIAEEIDVNYKKIKNIKFPTDGVKITRQGFDDKIAQWAIEMSGKGNEAKGRKMKITIF